MFRKLCFLVLLPNCDSCTSNFFLVLKKFFFSVFCQTFCELGHRVAMTAAQSNLKRTFNIFCHFVVGKQCLIPLSSKIKKMVVIKL